MNTDYTVAASAGNTKSKFCLQSDGTLGWTIPSKPDFGSVNFGSDNLAPVREFQPYISPYNLPIVDNICIIDWFRATATGAEMLFAVDAIKDMLRVDPVTGELDTDIEFFDTDRGLHGYPKTVAVQLPTDGGMIALGTIAYEPDPLRGTCGVMLDLSGAAFKYLRANCQQKIKHIYDFLSGYSFKITRIDVALDFDGEYCRANKITVPRLLALHQEQELFKSAGGGVSPTFDQHGDWSCIYRSLKNSVDIDDYNPAVHSPRGLTAEFGSRKCANFFRAYEKSKQLISVAELGEDHDLDKWAVRIEHEMKRDKNLPPIPFDVLIAPDYFFGIGRPRLREMLDAYRSQMDAETIKQANRARFANHQSLSIKAKVFWGQRAYGRLVNTLHASGLSKEQVFDLLVRDMGLKDFISDLDLEEGSGEFVDVEPLLSVSYADSSEKAFVIRRSYGLWQAVGENNAQ